jgi:D-alanyl-D-alanine carboxypeptidase
MSTKRIARFLFLFLLFNSLFVVAARADRIDDYVREQMQRRHIPGLALAVVRDGRLVKQSGYGLANLELRVPATPETVFEIGSVTKQMTAAAIMLLVEEGKVALDDPLSKYLPDTPEAWSGITIRHLLTHTSGLKNYTGLTGFELTEGLTREEFIKRIAPHPLAFAPGEQHSYGNTAYSLLGYVIEAASGRSYWQFVSERFFRPLGMRATTDRNPRRLVLNRAAGYEWDGREWIGRDYDLTDLFSSGAVVSTVGDLVKWEAALAGGRVLRPASLEQVWTPARLNSGRTYPYGFGWHVETLRGHRVVRHTGHTAGFSASLARYPDEKLTVIVLSNLGTLGVGGRIGLGVAKLYTPTLSLRNLRPQTDPDPPRARMIEAALRGLLSARPDPMHFTPERLKALSTEAARETWRRLAADGPLAALAFAGAEEQSTSAALRVVRYKVTLGRRLLLVRLGLTSEGRIAELTIEEEE